MSVFYGNPLISKIGYFGNEHPAAVQPLGAPFMLPPVPGAAGGGGGGGSSYNFDWIADLLGGQPDNDDAPVADGPIIVPDGNGEQHQQCR